MPTATQIAKTTLIAAGGASAGALLSAMTPQPQDGNPFFNLAERNVNAQAAQIAETVLFALAGAFLAYIAANTTAGTRAEDTRRPWMIFLSQLLGFSVATLVAIDIAGTAYPRIHPTDNATANEVIASVICAFSIGVSAYLSSRPLWNGRTGNVAGTEATAWYSGILNMRSRTSRAESSFPVGGTGFGRGALLTTGADDDDATTRLLRNGAAPV